MHVIITENIAGTMHEAADHINRRSPVYAETLIQLQPLTRDDCVAVYKVPDHHEARWMWGDLKYDMDRCPV